MAGFGRGLRCPSTSWQDVWELCLLWSAYYLCTEIKCLARMLSTAAAWLPATILFCETREKPFAFYDSTLFSHGIHRRTSYRRVDCRGIWCQACGLLHVLQGPEERHVLAQCRRGKAQELQGEGEARRGFSRSSWTAPKGGRFEWRVLRVVS